MRPLCISNCQLIVRRLVAASTFGDTAHEALRCPAHSRARGSGCFFQKPAISDGQRVAMMRRRAVLRGAMGGVIAAVGSVQLVTPVMAQRPIDQAPPEPLVWPPLAKTPSGIRPFNGHTDTVLDVVGRIGAPPSLVIFTEGNHLMVLLSDDGIGAFPSLAKSQRQYADLDLDHIVVSTLPQPILVEAIRAGGIAVGNLMLEVSRRSGFYPDIFMGYPEPLRQLRERGVVDSQARFFCRKRGHTPCPQGHHPR